ncbi:MAG TPA: lipocalin family protein [Iamia sp.]|nr:lipocalin family protein [Iamia sp.]
MRRASPLALALAVALAVTAGAGCSDDGDDDRSGPTTTTTTEAALPGPPRDPAVVGTWTADGGDQLVEALSNQGLDELPPCEGTLTLELRDDGGFTRTLAGTCAFADGDGEVELVASGGYATEGGELVLTNTSSTGAIAGEDGEELELPTDEAAEPGAATYEVTPDELVLGLADTEASLTFTRS